MRCGRFRNDRCRIRALTAVNGGAPCVCSVVNKLASLLLLFLLAPSHDNDERRGVVPFTATIETKMVGPLVCAKCKSHVRVPVRDDGHDQRSLIVFKRANHGIPFLK
jgi:hypothetical protein